MASQLPEIRGISDEGATRVFADGYENIRLSAYMKCQIKHQGMRHDLAAKWSDKMELLVDTTDQSGLGHRSRRAISVLAEPNH